jgi:hypothetical protein
MPGNHCWIPDISGTSTSETRNVISLNVCCSQIVLIKSKIAQPQKSRESQSLNFSAAALLFNAPTAP